MKKLILEEVASFREEVRGRTRVQQPKRQEKLSTSKATLSMPHDPQ